jgi:type I restriction enzyme S subunit
MSTATTHIKTEKRSAERSRSKLAPALRFKEFEGEWSKKKLSKVCQVNPKAEKLPNSFIYVDLESVKKGVLGKEERINKIDAPSRAQRLLTKNDILYQTVRPYQKNNYFFSKNNLDYVASTGYAQIRTDNSAHYIFQLLHTELFVNKVLLRCTGTSYPAINSSDLKSIPINIPTLPEQQKIASFLSAVDEKIHQLTKKKALLEKYKKGVMQQLFPSTGSGQRSGQLRFKPARPAGGDENGKDYPDWEWVGGNELFDNISDKKHNSDLPILAVTQDQGAIPRELINYKMTVTEASIASYKVVQKGDFIISLRTFQGGIEFSEYHGICSPAYNILRPSSDEVDRTFYKFYLKTSFYIRQLQKNLEGIRDGKMISYKYFSEIKVPFPSNPEQQKIATYLSSIDTKIESVNNQITQTQTFKKGLLQQMFV